MDTTLEKTILSHLIFNEDYTRTIAPHLKPEYFHQKHERIVYEIISAFIDKYNTLPTREALIIDLQARKDMSETEYTGALNTINNLSVEKTDPKWLYENTEQWCKKKAVFNAIYESIDIVENPTKNSDSIPDILSEALSVSFDKRVGHDYSEDGENRWKYYHTPQTKLAFGIDILDEVTHGGVPPKTLTVFIAPTGVGKTLVMTHCAAQSWLRGRNVLYITAEMAEEEISKRIDANLVDWPINDLINMPRETYLKRLADIKAKTNSRLIIKEYPTATASVLHIKALLKELKLKKNFTPDIIYVDYINIMTSARIKLGNNVNSYTLIKSISEELRGLAVEYKIPVISATQTNREGMKSSDLEMTNVSESVGLPFTVDLMIGVTQTDELEKLGQLLFKQLKNRFGDPTYKRKWVVGVDRSKMRIINLGEEAQVGLGKESADDGIPTATPRPTNRTDHNLERLRSIIPK